MPFIHRCLLCLVAFLSLELNAQPSTSFYFINYGEDQGLLGSSIYGIEQDDEGYIWIGTSEGLFKFDGATFQNHFEDHPFPSKIIDRVFHINNDSFVVLGGLPKALYTVTGNEWQPFDTKGHITNGIYFSHSPQDASLAFSDFSGVSTIGSGGAIRVLEKPKEERDMYLSVHAFNKDSLFVGREKSSFFLGKVKTAIPRIDHVTCFRDQKDSCLLFTKDSLYSYRQGEISGLTPIPKGHHIRYAVFDANDRLWFSGGTKGLFVMENGKVSDISSTIGIEGDFVTYLFQDRSKNIWVSTESSGLFYFPKGIFTNYSMVDGLNSRNITDLALWQGNLLAGTSHGLSQLTDDGILSGTALAKDLGVCERHHEAFNEYIFNITLLPNKLLLGATNQRKKEGACENYPLMVYGRRMAIQSGDTLFSCGWGNILSTLIKDRGFETINLTQTEQDFGKEYFIHRLPNHHFWVGRPTGLYDITADLSSTKPVKVMGFSGHINFFDIKPAQDGGFWFATSKGLLKLNVDNKWEQWTTNDGLTSDIIRTLEVDEKGTVWLGTKYGLNAFSKGQFSSYTQGSGLISNDVNHLLYDKKSNLLWVGTKKGISKLDLSENLDPGKPSFPLYINRIEIVGDTSYINVDPPELNIDQNNLRIHFASMNYVNPAEVMYQYRLFPGDSSWRSTTLNHAQYLALGADDYIFEVRSKTPGNSWGSTASVFFSITPPFWQTQSFTWALMIVLLSLSGLIFRRRVRIVKQREQNKNLMIQKINHLEQQALSLSMNPHFIFNSLNSIQHYLSEIKNREATKYISNFAKLIRLNMDSSKKRTIALNDEVARLNLYLSLEKARFDKEFSYGIKVDEELTSENPEIPNMVIQPLIENGIWHGILPSGRSGHIEVVVSAEGDTGLKIVVSDNGVGLAQARENARKNHKSQGLSLTKERLAFLSENNYLHIEELFNESGETTGTQSVVYIELD